ncbi:hypothetical protein EON67_00950 [archaeon]|nr:MAG: hypothetical protein EON67_00950 [archaeon]
MSHNCNAAAAKKEHALDASPSSILRPCHTTRVSVTENAECAASDRTSRNCVVHAPRGGGQRASRGGCRNVYSRTACGGTHGMGRTPARSVGRLLLPLPWCARTCLPARLVPAHRHTCACCVESAMATPERKRKEIYTFEAPWMVYGLSVSNNPDPTTAFRFAFGSFIEEYCNKVQVRRACEEGAAGRVGPVRPRATRDARRGCERRRVGACAGGRGVRYPRAPRRTRAILAPTRVPTALRATRPHADRAIRRGQGKAGSARHI